MASQVPDDLIAKLAAETGLSTDEVRLVAERAARFVDALRATGVVREEGIIRVWSCFRCWFCFFCRPVKRIFWCIVCRLLWRT